MSASQYFRSLAGLVIAALGVAVMFGWLFQYRGVVAFGSGNILMVFNTAVCFTLAGIAILVSTFALRLSPAIQIAAGSVLIFFGAAIFAEFLCDTSSGIDWPGLHGWLKNGNRLPGRMAPNAALGFLATGLLLIFLRKVSAAWQAWLILTLTFSVLAIGVTGLIFFTLTPDLLFGWASSERMTVPTSLGFILIAMACWMQWQGAEWYDRGEHFHDDDKILFMAAAILALVTVAAGLSGFSLQQSTLEHLLRQTMATNLDTRVTVFQKKVADVSATAASAARRADVIALADQLARNHGADAGRSAISHADWLNTLDVQSLELRDTQHRLLLRIGASSAPSHRLSTMPLPGEGTLEWQGGLVLETVSPVNENGQLIGELVLRHSLGALYATLVDASGLGLSGEVLICSDKGGSLLCLPTRRDAGISMPARMGRYGNTLPMALAASGEAGATATVDYLNHNVNAAFRPLAPGLGIAIKQDTAELYGPVRQHFVMAAIVLLLLVTLGVAVLRSQIKPLARRLIASEMMASEKEQQISTMFASVGEGIMTVDLDGKVDSCNPAACQIFGSHTERVKGIPLQRLIPGVLAGGDKCEIRISVDGAERQIEDNENVELTGVRVDGATFPLELVVNTMFASGCRSYVVIVRDISRRKEAERKLNQLARFDLLTGLPNRAHFMELLHGALVRAQRHRQPLALMFLDLDGFKQINDTLGHHAGDEMLRQFGKRLSASVRKSDTVSRLAGDEFTIILEDVVHGESDALGVANKILSAMAHPFALGPVERIVSTSIGLAVHLQGEIGLEELLHRADTAMYEAKRGGKNQVRLAAHF